MVNFFSFSAGIAVLFVASILVVAEDSDPCTGVLTGNATAPNLDNCLKCVNTSIGQGKGNCSYEPTPNGGSCTSKPDPAQGVPWIASNATDCNTKIPTPAPETTTTSTTAPPTTNATTVPTTTAPPPTNATTTSVPTTTSAPPNSTTTAVPTTTNGTSTVSPTTTPSSNSSTTAAPKPTPAASGGMSVGSFFAGIVFTLCMSGLGYLIFRFYRARMDRNYHTFSNPTF